MVGAGAVVAEADRRPWADEHGTSAGDLSCDTGCVLGLNLEVLGRISVDDAQTSGNIGDQHGARLAAGQRRGDARGAW